MVRILIATVLAAFLTTAAAAQAPKKETGQDEIDSLFAIIDRLTEGASPAERLCYFAANAAEYRKCRFPYIMKETWVNHSSGSLCRFTKYDEVVNGSSAAIKGLGSNVLREVSETCDVYARMRFEYRLIQRIKRDFVARRGTGS